MKDTSAQAYIPIIQPTLPDESELSEQISRILQSGRVTTGEQVLLFEEEIRKATTAKYAVAVSSGTSGLMLLLRALNLPEGSEVITPSFTFAATSHALLWNHLKPVFCDSEPDSFTMDADAAERLINENTSAIYPVNIFGVPGDIQAYERLAAKYNIHLIFDSAQGLGGAYNGKAVGSFGSGEVFSLSPTKVVTALEGGIVTTNDESLARTVRYMRDYGKAPDGEDMNWLGLSARMPEINATVARWSLARINVWISRRKAIMDLYRERLTDIPGTGFQRIPDHCVSARNYMVILLDPQVSPITRDELYLQLKQEGIQTKRYFYPALHNQTLYRDLDPDCRTRLTNAERISSRSLALPMYSHMPIQQVEIICDYLQRLCDR